MKAGKTLQALAAEIDRQHNAKIDVFARTDHMAMEIIPSIDPKAPPIPQLVMAAGSEAEQRTGIKPLAHTQISEHVKIPAIYYNRMLSEAPELLTTNVGHWFRKHPVKRLVRMLDGNARAFLSDSYRPLDNHDLAEAVLPILQDLGLIFMSTEITDTRLYIKAVDPRIERDCPTGRKIGDGSHVIYDTLSPAVIVSNSEVGLGMLKVEYGVYTKQCTNMASFADGGMKKRHLGARAAMDDGETIRHLLSDATKQATDRAVFMQVRDIVKASFEEAQFEARVGKIKEASERKIQGDPVKVVELTAKRFGFGDGERKSILQHLIEGGSLTQYGLSAAITRSAEDVADYDQASSMERLGGRVIDLEANEWKKLALVD